MTEQPPDGWFQHYVKSNRVFILGAGFSAAAGVPLTSSLLQKTMRKFSAECPGLFERVDAYARESIGSLDLEIDYSAIDLANFCTFLEYVELCEYGGSERWTDAGSREKLALRFYLAKTTAEHTPSPNNIPGLYLQFVSQLHERDVIISFNWDCLLEVTLRSLGKRYAYNSEDNAIKLYKLHGSVNWRLDHPSSRHGLKNTLGWRSLNFTKGMMKREMYHASELIEGHPWTRYPPLGEVEPFLVLPGYGKAFDVRFNAPLWYKPDFAFAGTHDVFIIGLSLSPDDFLVRSLFLSNLPYIDSYSGVEGRHIYIINPDPRAEENYQFVLSRGFATLLKEPFAEAHIELMKGERSPP